MDAVVRVVQTHFSHACAVVILASVLGAIRLAGASSVVGGRRRLARLLGVAWLALLLVVTYAVPPVGLWAVGLVVPLFADSHFQAWVVEQPGGANVVRKTVELIRKAGPVRYFAMASTRHLLQGSLGLLIVAVSVGRNSWEYWLGMGILSSAGLGMIGHAVRAWQYRHDARSSGAAEQGDEADEAW